jgi:murein DD-endopeptidase MepM/ murein hydrolase activator NlpD
MKRAWIAGAWLALWACAGIPSHGSGDASPNGCEWQVCVYAASSPDGVSYRVRNAGPVAATVTLSFEVLRNLRPTDPVPVVRVVPAGESVLLVHLVQVDSLAGVGAHPFVEIDLGSDATEPDTLARYALPFGGEDRRQLIAGYGSDTHLRENFYSLDFRMPEGTPVLAARAGVVVEVQDGFTRGGLRPELIERANLVAVAHADGTMASYGHLLPGVAVAIGDTVVRGQRLGLSGSTGFSATPHLHFHVGKRLMGGMDRTIPVRFRNEDGAEVEMVEGRWYEPSGEVHRRPEPRDAGGSDVGSPGKR